MLDVSSWTVLSSKKSTQKARRYGACKNVKVWYTNQQCISNPEKATEAMLKLTYPKSTSSDRWEMNPGRGAHISHWVPLSHQWLIFYEFISD